MRVMQVAPTQDWACRALTCLLEKRAMPRRVHGAGSTYPCEGKPDVGCSSFEG